MDDNELAKKLLGYQEEIKAAKNEIERLTGHVESLMNELEKKYNIKTIDEAEQFIKDADDELDQLEVSIEQGVNRIERKYFSQYKG
jgi:peptidoglycan hydrolase CwlO-like protein